MRATYKGVTVHKGDRVTVEAQGRKVTGTVVHVEAYTPPQGVNANDDGWLIEMVDANVLGGHSYWKQYLDGGQVIEVNGESVTNNKRRDQ